MGVVQVLWSASEYLDHYHPFTSLLLSESFWVLPILPSALAAGFSSLLVSFLLSKESVLIHLAGILASYLSGKAALAMEMFLASGVPLGGARPCWSTPAPSSGTWAQEPGHRAGW